MKSVKLSKIVCTHHPLIKLQGVEIQDGVNLPVMSSAKIAYSLPFESGLVRFLAAGDDQRVRGYVVEDITVLFNSDDDVHEQTVFDETGMFEMKFMFTKR